MFGVLQWALWSNNLDTWLEAKGRDGKGGPLNSYLRAVCGKRGDEF